MSAGCGNTPLGEITLCVPNGQPFFILKFLLFCLSPPALPRRHKYLTPANTAKAVPVRGTAAAAFFLLRRAARPGKGPVECGS
jgi:hypothetical protein